MKAITERPVDGPPTVPSLAAVMAVLGCYPRADNEADQAAEAARLGTWPASFLLQVHGKRRTR